MGVTSALATPPPWLGIALAILIGGMGALQIAAIASEPIPQASPANMTLSDNRTERNIPVLLLIHRLPA